MLSLITLMLVEVEFDVATSVQFTSMPFKTSVTGLIASCDVSGRLPAAEILEKVNLVEFTTKSDVADCEDTNRERLLAVASPS